MVKALPKFEEYKAPWEQEGAELDPAKIKRHYYNLLADKEKVTEQLATVTTERDEARSKVTEFETRDMTELQKLQRENEELKAKGQKTPEQDLELARLRVAVEKKLTLTQAKRLVGTTEDELAADADEYLKEVSAGGGQGGVEEGKPGPDGRFITGSERGEPLALSDPAELVKYV